MSERTHLRLGLTVRSVTHGGTVYYARREWFDRCSRCGMFGYMWHVMKLGAQDTGASVYACEEHLRDAVSALVDTHKPATCTCPMSLRGRGEHSTACPMVSS